MMLVDYAHKAGREFTALLPRTEQKRLGQFMTPPAIASFMARRLVAGFDRDHVRVLEPSAGAGVLAAAVVEELLVKPHRPSSIELTLYECDHRLLPALDELGKRMDEACTAAGVTLHRKVQHGDFLLSELALGGKPAANLLTIANPPFFKLNKTTDVRARLHAYAVWGQPNIYGLFMAACARLTAPGSRWCFITPRSWMNGQYFQATRQAVLRHLVLDSLHAFESRRDSFEEDAVLQETVIAWAVGRSTVDVGVNIVLTKSRGTADLDAPQVMAVPSERVVGDDDQAMLSLPLAETDSFEGWTATLKTYGLEVSTGPVVAFRATEFIRESAEEGTVPLLWLQHVGQQSIRWPIRKKREHILATSENAWMLVKNAPMVLLRRFSPKEDERRVTCAAYGCDPELLPGDVIGLENHLNYIHRPRGRMSSFEARGLAAFLASSLADAHFRALAGSTQVNAAELRRLPLPPLAIIEEMGRRVGARPTLAEIDSVVSDVLGLGQQQAAA